MGNILLGKETLLRFFLKEEYFEKISPVLMFSEKYFQDDSYIHSFILFNI